LKYGKEQAVAALAALAQDSRLDMYRLLVRAGPDGVSAGQVATELGLAPNTLTFHFDRLRHAGLITVRRAGRSMIYAARFDTHERPARIPDRELLQGRVQRLRRSACVGGIGPSKKSKVRA